VIGDRGVGGRGRQSVGTIGGPCEGVGHGDDGAVVVDDAQWVAEWGDGPGEGEGAAGVPRGRDNEFGGGGQRGGGGVGIVLRLRDRAAGGQVVEDVRGEAAARSRAMLAASSPR